ncbi:MAG TPA: SDR family NAD(P)-dependent oxidoreductase [Parvularculaceae bacterium]|nr:SDR family NAD(P)-dependent oxidoreductase [Parvularculaceae bacterium]
MTGMAFENPLIIGASGGIGSAVAARLGRCGAVEPLSRARHGFDLLDEASIKCAAARLSGGTFDFIFIATGQLAADAGGPERSFREVDIEAMNALFAVNATGPALIIKHFAPLLDPDKRSVLAFLSARIGSIGDNRLGGWMSYRASKAALNQIVKCAAIEIARTRPEAIILALHPGTIETAMTRGHARGRYTASPDACAEQLLNVCERATPKMSGGFYAYDGSPIPW